MRIIYTLGFLFAAVQMFGQGPAPRMETNLDDVYSMYNLSGDGVLAVVIDRGIDYRHPDFIDENGNTRIKYIFDMIDDSGVSEPGNTYGVGTIWDEAEINQALANNTNPPLTMDRYGHGTATAGIFGGDGSGTNDLAFQGVAPGVNYIIIKLTQDPFPAFGNQPAQAAFFDPTYIPVALDFAHDKITELNMPSVTLLNLGSTGGPTDGTSLITREIDQFIAQGHVFVCGVGDDGGGDNHASGTITQGQTIELQINKVSAGFLRLDLWYSEDDRFTVSFERPDGTTEGPFAAPGGPGLFNDQFMSGISMFHRGADVEFFGATSNRRELLVDFSGATGVYKVILTGATISDGSFNATLNPGNFNSNNAFLTFVTPGTSIADYAASIFGITPTDYVVDNTWTDIDGIPRAINGQGNPGELWLGSSEGPTQDGRRGVDFATPGEVCIAAYSPDTYYENFSFNVVQGSNGLYGLQTAVSAAAPLASGIIALMLEVNPDLSPTEVKSILQNSCIADSFTGTVPNNTWGFGKLDALQVIQNTLQTVSTEDLPEISSGLKLFPNPASDQLMVELVNTKTEIIELKVYNMQGQGVTLPTNTVTNAAVIETEKLASGFYLVSITTNEGVMSQRFFKN